MAQHDASVWTGEPVDVGGDYHHATVEGEPCGIVRLLKGTRCGSYWVRSILPVPSAERHAALEAVAEAAKEGERLEEKARHFGAVVASNVARWESLVERVRANDQRLTAALARLEATR